jgi:hypothetical protein
MQSGLSKPKCINNARQFSFACRRVNTFNFLPFNVVSAVSFNGFEAGLSTVDFNTFLKYSV